MPIWNAKLFCVVWGEPIPQGSMKAFNVRGRRHPIVTSDNPRTKPWKWMVTCAAREAMQGRLPFEGPIMLRLDFYLHRPKSTPKRVLNQIHKPDLDKLVRAILDALTNAGVWGDDAQVVKIDARKVFAMGQYDPQMTVPRAEIEVLTP